MAYLPLSTDDRGEMLQALGMHSQDELFSQVPAGLRNPALDLPPPPGEQELVAEIEGLAAQNHPLSTLHAFLGAGVYRRFIPAIVRGTIARPEFYTAYTPYQAEASQGTLQTIFEFQTMICELTGMEVANASLYDGATAAAEGLLLAVAHTGRRRVLVSEGVHPQTREVIDTYARGRGVQVDTVRIADGVTPAESVRAELTSEHAAVLVQQPSFFGTVESLQEVADAAHAVGALAVAAVDPLACVLLAPPGACGFDVAVGDGQPLGIPASFGGPHVGFMAVQQALLRRMPGRLVGITLDHAGRRAYTLTLQTREQHIRREHATSNICTNHALMALAATVYMAHMGAGGMRRVAEVSVQRTHDLAWRLTSIDGFELAHPRQTHLWEFVLRCPLPAEQVVATLRRAGIVGGLPLGRLDAGDAHELLVCCTEMTSPAAIDRYVEAARGLVQARMEASV